jgi:hypothetical protein
MPNEFVARNGVIAQNNSTVSGSLVVTNGVTGSLLGTSSYASNTNLLDGLDSSAFASTSSFQNYTSSANAGLTALNAQTASLLNYTSSTDAKISSIYTTTASLNASVAGLNLQTASLLNYTASNNANIASIYTTTASLNASVAGLNTYSASLNNKTSSFATTGSNTFNGTQTITGSLNVSSNITTPGTITATTLVVQTITSSQNFITGSTKFGILTSNTHQFTGSVSASGSLAINTNVLYVDGTNVGIGTTSPAYKLHVNGGDVGTSGFFNARYNSSNETYKGTFGWNHIQLGNNGSNDIIAGRTATGGAFRFIVNQTGSYSYDTYDGIIAMTIKADGNVGIGTATAQNLLHVRSGASGLSSYDSRYKVVLENNGEAYYAVTVPDNSYAGLRILGTSSSPRGAVEYYMTDNLLHVYATGSIRFYNGAAESMRILSGGNVGIGTTSPSEKLHLYANASSVELRMENSTISSYIRSQTDNLNFYVNGGERMRITSGGNVGIGTTSPTARLQISGDGSSYNLLRLNHNGTGTNGFLDISVTDTRATISTNYSSTNIPLEIKSYGNTNQLFLATDGNVGIGTSNPTRTLHILGPSGIGSVLKLEGASGTTTYLQLSYNGATNSQSGYIGYDSSANMPFFTNNTERIRIQSDGNVGIATTSPSAILHVQGLGASQNADSVYITNKRGGYFPLKILVTQGDYQGVLIEHEDGTGSGGPGPYGTYGFKFDDKRISGTYVSHPSASFVIARSNTYNNTNIFEVRPYNAQPAIAVATGGNVGIGTASPGYRLQVNGISGTIARITDGTNNLDFYAGSSLNEIAATTALVLSTNSAERMRITSGGNVGIGTTTPSARFHVNGSTGASTYKGFAYTYGGSETLINEVLFQVVVGGYSSNLPMFLFKDERSDQGTTQRIFEIQGGRSGVGTILTTLASGNVGIGTTSPGVKLYVSASDADYATIIKNTNTSGYGLQVLTAGSSTNLAFQVRTNNTSTNAFQVLDNGNVGIGTTSPAAPLHVASENNNNDGTIKLGVRGWVQHRDAGNTIFSIANDYNSDSARMEFRMKGNTTSDAKMTILGNGNVGVSTTAPAYRFQSNGPSGDWSGYFKGSSTSNNSYGLFIDAGTTSADSPFMVRSADGGTVFLRILGNGNVGIGTTSPTDELQVVATSGNGITITTNDVSTLKMRSSAGTTKNWGFATTNLAASDFGIYQSTSNNGDPISAGTARLYFDGSGNVGIGRTSPSYKLDVSGSTRTFGYLLGVDNSTTIKYVFTNDGGASYINSGNVGIGTTSPSTKLHVVGTSTFTDEAYFTDKLGVGTVSLTYKAEVAGAIAQYWNGTAFTGTPLALAISNTNAGGYDPVLLYRQADSGGTTKLAGGIGLVGTGPWTAGNNASQTSDMYFLVRNASGGISERMRIKSDGNVGIGTTSPSTKLHVQDTSDAYTRFTRSSGTTQNLDVGTNSAGEHFVFGYGAYPLLLGTNSNTRIYITSGGSVGIGTTSPSEKLDLSGTFRQSTTSTQPVLIYGDSGDTNGLFRIQMDSVSDSFGSGARTYLGDGGIDIFIGTGNSSYTPSNTYIALNHSGEISMGAGSATKHLVINTSGNVGIGSASPQRKLVVSGDTNIGGSIVMGGISDSGGLGTGAIYMLEGQGIAWYNSAFNAGRASIQGTSAGHIILAPTANVGIGTTSPGSNLHIKGSNDSGADFGAEVRVWENTFGASLQGSTQGNTAAFVGNFRYNFTTAGSSIQNYPNAGQGILFKDGIHVYSSNPGGSGGGTFTPSERLTIKTDGNVGIGTTSPGSILHILDTSANDTTLIIGQAGEVPVIKAGGANTDLQLEAVGAGGYLNFVTNGTSRMLIGGGGNVGIGTTSPGYKLDVKGTGYFDGPVYVGTTSNRNYFARGDIRLTDSVSNVYVLDIGASSTSGRIATNYYGGGANIPLVLQSYGNDNQLYLATNGRVGIGTTSPSSLLHVGGGVTINSTTPFTFIGNGNAGTYTQTAIYSNQNNTSNNTANGIFIERGRITDSASAEIRNFVIGDRGGGIQLLLDKDGKLTVTNDVVAYGSPSDISLKTNIKPLENSLDKIIKLQGVSFTWKENTSENNLIGIKDDIGFIAQEVQEILPDLVRKNDNGLLSLRDKGITALLVEAIKELKAEIDELKNK